MIDYIYKPEDVPKALDCIRWNTNVLGWDTETCGDGLDPFRSSIRLMQFANEKRAFVFDMFFCGKDGFRSILANTEIKKVAHNAKFDCKHSNYQGFIVQDLFCCMVAEQRISNGTEFTFNLKDILYRRGLPPVNKELQRSNFGGQLSQQQIEYAGTDALRMLPLYEKQMQDIHRLDIKYLIDLEMELIPIIARMELAGIYMDPDRVLELKNSMLKEVQSNLHTIQSQLPRVELPKSYFTAKGALTKKGRDNYPEGVRPPQTRDDFIKAYTILGVDLPTVRDKATKKTRVSLSAETYGKIQHPTGPLLEEYFSKKKLVESYLAPVVPDVENGVTGWINPITGRIHGNIHQFGTQTGRFTITDPPLQTVPRDDDRFRRLVRARPGYKILKVDYSQIEMRVIAELTRDANLIKVYIENLDVYKMTASGIFGKSYDSITKTERQDIGKPVTLGTCYGQGPTGLITYIYKMTGKTYSLDQTRKFWKGFLDTYPGIRAYHDHVRTSTLAKWEQDYYAKSLNGTFRCWQAKTIPRGFNQKSGESYTICNDVINHPIQSTVGELMKYGMVLLHRDKTALSFLQSQLAMLLLQVHDELVFEVRAECVKEFCDVVGPILITAMKRSIKVVPIGVEMTWGDDWGSKEGTLTYAG